MRKMVVVGLACVPLMMQTNAGMGMRHPMLNDLRGFDIACRVDSLQDAEALCASLKAVLISRFNKPVTVHEPGDLPRSPQGGSMLNRVWIQVLASVQGDMLALRANWGSSMNMAGVGAESTAEPVRIRADASADEQAAAILDKTPFR